MESGPHGPRCPHLHGEKSEMRRMSHQRILCIGIFEGSAEKFVPPKKSRAIVQRDSKANLSGEDTESTARQTAYRAADRQTSYRSFQIARSQMDKWFTRKNGR